LLGCSNGAPSPFLIRCFVVDASAERRGYISRRSVFARM
jgi:hypothetical protein